MREISQVCTSRGAHKCVSDNWLTCDVLNVNTMCWCSCHSLNFWRLRFLTACHCQLDDDKPSLNFQMLDCNRGKVMEIKSEHSPVWLFFSLSRSSFEMRRQKKENSLEIIRGTCHFVSPITMWRLINGYKRWNHIQLKVINMSSAFHQKRRPYVVPCCNFWIDVIDTTANMTWTCSETASYG